MKMKIILIIILNIIILGCNLDSETKFSSNQLTLSSSLDLTNNSIINISFESKNYNVDDLVILDLKAEEDTYYLGFDLLFDDSVLEINNIEKVGLSEDNFVSSSKIENGYKFIFSDMKNYLIKDQKFAKITLKVKKNGQETIELGNVMKE